MTLTLEGLKAQFQHPNVSAFARCVRSAESNNRDDGSAYRTIFGGELIDDLSCHPRIARQSKWGWTSAAGAYQAMCSVPGRVQTDTWGDFCRDMGVPVDAMPFDQPTQDAFLVWCVRRRNALQAVIDGDLEKAITLCSYEWASFPPGRYGQPTTTVDKLRAVFLQYGGRLSNADLIQPAAPIEERPQPPQPQQPENAMPLPLLAIVSAISTWGPTIAALIPQVATLFDRDKATPAKLEAAQAVVTKIVETTGAVNTEAAIGAITSDAAMLEKVRSAVITAPEIMPYVVVEVGPGIEKTQAANLAAQTAERGFWRNPAFWFVMTAVVPPLYGVVGVLLWRMPAPSEQLVTQVVTGILGLAAVAGAYYLGSTQGSATKTAIIANQAGKQ
jgi:muramidase (phage lysozyme)